MVQAMLVIGTIEHYPPTLGQPSQDVLGTQSGVAVGVLSSGAIAMRQVNHSGQMDSDRLVACGFGTQARVCALA
jgi:hypothetical protein